MNQISTFLTLFLLCLTSNSFVNAQTVGFYAPYEDMENECKILTFMVPMHGL